MNLLQKLSFDCEDVDDWRELVDAIFIDWHYDGVTFSPELTDIPDARSKVVGCYDIPKDAGRIHIRITDLISESWTATFDANGEKQRMEEEPGEEIRPRRATLSEKEIKEYFITIRISSFIL